MEPGRGVVVGVDLLHVDERQADGALQALSEAVAAPAAVTYAATHWAGGAQPHVALSLEVAGVDDEAVWRLVGTALARVRDRPDASGPWALSLDRRTSGAPALVASAELARRAHVSRSSGRAVRFPGVGELVGVLPVPEVLGRSAIDRVSVLLGGEAGSSLAVDTRGHVRPTWVDGRLVLLTQPASGGTLVPFESPHPTPCCADHA